MRNAAEWTLEALTTAFDWARQLSIEQRLVVAGLLAGLSSGLAAFAFHETISWIASKTLDVLPEAGALRFFGLVAVPALGAGAAVLLIAWLSPESAGHGVNEVLAAVNTDGKIPSHVAWVKLLASALTIGTGGSTGREGPIIQIGGAVGSTVGRWLRLPLRDLRFIVAAGATAGLAASFGVPLAAVFFTMEVLLPELPGEPFSAVVIASTVGAVTAGTLLGGKTFAIPLDYRGASFSQIWFFALLGLLLAPMGTLYMRSIEAIEKKLHTNSWSPLWTAPAGGAIVGLIAWIWPEVLGTGQNTIETALRGGFGPERAAAVSVAKIAATAATIGCGAPGGAFMPAMVIGACAGAACAGGAHALGFPVDVSSFALAGMSAVITAAYRAPVTGIVMALEMSRDYDALPPVMLACAVAILVARHQPAKQSPVLEQ